MRNYLKAGTVLSSGRCFRICVEEVKITITWSKFVAEHAVTVNYQNDHLWKKRNNHTGKKIIWNMVTPEERVGLKQIMTISVPWSTSLVMVFTFIFCYKYTFCMCSNYQWSEKMNFHLIWSAHWSLWYFTASSRFNGTWQHPVWAIVHCMACSFPLTQDTDLGLKKNTIMKTVLNCL